MVGQCNKIGVVRKGLWENLKEIEHFWQLCPDLECRGDHSRHFYRRGAEDAEFRREDILLASSTKQHQKHGQNILNQSCLNSASSAPLRLKMPY
jgi:hypothetical protein